MSAANAHVREQWRESAQSALDAAVLGQLADDLHHAELLIEEAMGTPDEAHAEAERDDCRARYSAALTKILRRVG